ncbi:9208_t:CDS:2 [Gigaspora margarita]|uniref:9208_t:CDS:1 n=1 Tax=Gigaspora margarita TaxID=4874 RepID=A0ABM8W1I5_GIGMA|nr:9208_t:CDS:2 [Gigaspora margarita]
MQYSKGLNKGSLLSPFLQNKILSFINSLLYKSGQDSDSLTQRTLSQHKRKQSQHISKVHVAAHRPLLADSQSLKAINKSTRGQQKMFCVLFWNSKSNKPDFQVLEMKDLLYCTRKSVAQAMYDALGNFSIDL